MEIKGQIQNMNYNIKHSILELKTKMECDRKYRLLNKNLKKIAKNTDEETQKYWKSVQKKYCYEKSNLTYETQYDYWMLKNDLTPEQIKTQMKTKFESNPKISILTPLYKTDTNFFRELLYFMEQQTYTNWELCLADGSPEPLEEIQCMIKGDSRIKYKFLNKNNGIADNTNEALKLATGDFIALMDHDDTLTIDCLFEYVKAINEKPNTQFLYCDEDKIYEVGKKRFGAHFKPDFAIDTLRSENYICHFSVLRKDIMDKLEGERSKYDGAQDFDLVLRMAEIVDPKNIIHIPKILYHWRLSETSTAANADAKPYAYIAGKNAVEDHLERMGIEATVTRSKHYGLYDTIYKVKGNPKVNILIVNKEEPILMEKCIKSILEKTNYQNYEIDIIDNCSENEKIQDYYKKIEENSNVRVLHYKEKTNNYSKLINFGIENTDGEFILQLNCKTEVKESDWLENMIGTCQRNDVAIVGAKLLDKENKIMHAGLILGMEPIAGFIHKGLPEDEPGFFARAIIRQDVSAVTGACLLSKREIYEKIGNLNEDLKDTLNDVDFCLKAIKAGYLVVYDPSAKLYYSDSDEEKKEDLESYNREIELFKNIWKKELENGDPYYNKNLDLSNTNCLIRTDTVK